MPDVNVKLTIGSVSVEVGGPPEYVDKKLEELVSRFLSSRMAVSSEPSVSSVTLATGGKKTSPAEFLKKTTAKNQFDRALVLGYYLERFEAATGFTSTELGNLGRVTKQPFGNPSDAVAKLSARGLMMSAGDKEGQRAYALTASGEAYVESLLKTNQ